MPKATHLIGLLLGTEEDWPSAFEALVRRSALNVEIDGTAHSWATERVMIEPFSLRSKARHSLVIDRLAYWYYAPREWLKKIALMDGVYLLNSPFTFQAMEKHAAYCAMMRLGLKVPETWLIPQKMPPEHPKFPYTAARYNRPFSLEEVAEEIGYPLYMKPYDGGAWVGVTRITNPQDLRAAYDESGQRIMHLQKAVDGFDVFARSLSIGAETMVMHFNPDLPMHDRYTVRHGFLSPSAGDEVLTIGRLVNAFFRWEFNSCETLIRGDEVSPIDYANACPDIAITSLHYYFPWAISALLRWSVFCTATGRRMRVDQDTARYFDIGDSSASYEEKLSAYRLLADSYFEVARYQEFRATHLAELDEAALAYFDSREFDDLLVATVRSTFPDHEHDYFISHYRGLIGAWVKDQG